MAFDSSAFDTAISSVEGIRELIELSRPPRILYEWYDEEKKKEFEQKQAELFEKIKRNIGVLPPEKISEIRDFAFSQPKSKDDEIIETLRKIELDLEEIKKGHDTRSDLRKWLDSLKDSATIVYYAVLAIEIVRKLILGI